METVKIFRERERDSNLPKDPKLNRQVEERPRAPLGKIQVIMRGSTMIGSSKKERKTCLRMVQSAQITRRLPKLARINKPTISFTEDNASQFHHSHDNVLVNSLLIANFNTRLVQVDNGSSANILYYPACR